MKYPTLVLLCCLLLPLTSAAEEGDASHAPPERWAHPRGPASGSGRSKANGPESFGGIAWSYKAKSVLLCSPVTWDGAVFVLDGSRTKAKLVALDSESGEVLGNATVPSPGDPRPAAWNRSIFLVEEGRKLVQYRLKGRDLSRAWTFDAGVPCSAPRIHAGEIYLATKKGLMRLRTGRPQPVWKAEGAFRGEPAVFGDHVMVVRKVHGGDNLELAVHARQDGAEVLTHPLGPGERSNLDARIAMSDKTVAVCVPAGVTEKWYLLRRKYDEDKKTVSFESKEEREFRSEPLVGPDTVIAQAKDGGWGLINYRNTKRPYFPMVTVDDRPDLYDGSCSAVSMNGMVSFGTWASRINGNLIAWHLDADPSVREFADGVRWNIPLGHRRALAVTRDGRAMHALREEEIGE